MNFFTISLIVIFYIIDDIENASIIHPIHVQTIPLHSLTVKPISTSLSSRKPTLSSSSSFHSTKYSWWYKNNSTQFTTLISSSSITYYHSSWWHNSHSTGRIILRFFLYVILIGAVSLILRNVCKSRKKEKQLDKTNFNVVNNKMYISTIEGKHEEALASYIEIHNV